MSREYPCIYHKAGCCTKFPPEPDYTDFCVYGPCGLQKRSNGDRLRAMEDDELALFLAERMAKQSILRLADEGVRVTETQKRALVEQLYFVWLRWITAPEEVET